MQFLITSLLNLDKERPTWPPNREGLIHRNGQGPEANPEEVERAHIVSVLLRSVAVPDLNPMSIDLP
jgi:hypothetical protein